MDPRREPQRWGRALGGLLVALLLLAGGCGGLRPAARAPADPATRPIEREVIRLTNAHRRAHRLPVLREDPLLAALARGHSLEMARAGGSIHHRGMRGRFERAARALPLTSFGENVARTRRLRRTPPASWVVSRWVESESHRVHLEGAYGLVGVGVVRSPDGGLYFTQLFGAVRDGG